MWIIEGAFDGLDAVDRTKRKVLYPDNAYELGRGSILLHLAQTVVSTHHATVTVGPHPLESANDPQAIPKLEYTQCNKKKTAIVGRIDEDGPRIPPQQTAQLRSGDQVHISGAQIFVRFTWEPVTVLIRSGVPRDDRDDLTTSLARLGIKSSRVWSDHVTHVVFSAVSHPYDFKILAALVHGVHLISPAWLRHVARRGNAPIEDGKQSDSENFQMTFQGLEEEMYRPDGAGLQAWAPNQTRKTLFCNIRFLFITVTDIPRDIFDVLPQKELITQHRIAPDDDITMEEWTKKLESALRAVSRLDSKPGISRPFVVAGDSRSLEQSVGPRWESVYMAGLREQGIRLIWLAELSNALLKNDLSYVDSSTGPSCIEPTEGQRDSQRSTNEVASGRRTRASSRQPSLPPAVPSSHLEEVSPDARGAPETAPTKKLARRATSRKQTPVPHASVEPVENTPAPEKPEEPKIEEDEEIPAQRTLLKRRATRRAPSAEPTGSIAHPSVPTFGMDFTLDIPDIPAARGLKRRATGRKAQTQVNGSLQSMSGASAQPSIREEDEEPRHKKFKALFEGTQGPLQSAEILDDSVPASVSRKETGGTIPSFVSDPLAGATSSALTKRKANEAPDIGGEREESENVANRGELMGKRRRVDGSGSNKPGSLLKNQVMVELSQGTQTPAEQQSNPELQSSFTSDDSQTRRAYEETRGRVPEGDANAKTKSSRRVKIESPNKGGSQVKVEPDQDRHFLQALASRTKTRSKEDDFDREFNQLRIAVPDKSRVENDQLRKEMAVWNEVEHDPNLRGNFMVVEYCDDVLRPTGDSRAKAFNEAWNGQPNFKKFKKKAGNARHPKLELDLPPPVDYGLGDSYWQRDDLNITIGPDAVHPLIATSQATKQVPRRKPLELKVNTSSDEEVPPPPVKRGRIKKAAPVIDLHFSESDEVPDAVPPEEESEIFDMNVSVVDEDDGPHISSNTFRSTGSRVKSQRQGLSSTNPTQSQRSSRKTSGTKRKATALPDDDDDDDDESDDNMAFRGFNRKKKIKR